MSILKDKVAIVTGGGSGIGEAVARAYAREGAKLIITDIDSEGGQKVVDDINNSGGHAIFFEADISSAEDCEASVKKAIDEYGRLDIACNNAWIGGDQANIAETSLDSWNKVISVNLNGVFYGMKYQIPAMMDTGGGCIVNIASVLGKVGTPMSAPYVAAKHGVIGLTQNAGLEFSKKGIRVNAVGPGYIKTPLLEENLSDEQMEQLVGAHPIGRLGEADEVAELVLWLSSEKSSFAVGTYYALDGGYLAQ